MDQYFLWAYLAAIVIGLVLGLIGGGGSILTVPVLTYLLGFGSVIATAYSLFIVGVTALFGAVRNFQKGLINKKIALIFSIPALLSVYAVRRYLMPKIPEEILHVNNWSVGKDAAIMLLFAIIMLLSALSMIRSKKKRSKPKSKSINYPLILVEGVVVGGITGIVGAGGGFIIIPALVLLAKLPMKEAVATSLLIIAIKSLIGFTGDVMNLTIDWVFLLSFSAFSILGIFIGIYLNKWVEGERLKKLFGWFVLLMAIYILWKEIDK